MLVASPPQGPVGPAGPREDSPAAAAIGTPVHRGSPVSHQASDEGDVPEEEIGVAIVVATQMIATPQQQGVGRRMGSRIRFRSLNSEARKDILKM